MKTILFNPFQKFSEKQLISFGILATIVGGTLSIVFNGRFDGIFDLHFVEKNTLFSTIIDFTINLFLLSLILFVLGILINKKTRFIDILAVGLISKIPFYFLLFFNIDNKMFLVTEKLTNMLSKKEVVTIETFDMALLVFSGITTFTCLVWTVILIYNGFKTATNLKELKHTLLFIMSLILAEVLSKIIVLNSNY